MDDRWYFAYGSNLSREQMELRTSPIRKATRAYLDGYRVTFNKRVNDGTGKASIVQDAGARVWGVIYWCSPSDLRKMDKHEGVSGGHYVRATVRVRTEAGDEIDAVTYVAGDSFIDNLLVPSGEYLQTILQGAREHALPPDYISHLETRARRSENR